MFAMPAPALLLATLSQDKEPDDKASDADADSQQDG
jgi:hypothetical protein